MNKKKILFISSNMEIGGFQKGLVSLLRCFDYDAYDVDLLLFSHTGVFMELIPEQVRILPPIMPESYFQSAPTAVRELIAQGKIGLSVMRLCAGFFSRIDKGVSAKILSLPIPKLKGEYDAAIDFNGQHILYYMANKVTAARKITFFHSDYIKWPYYKRVDRVEYKKVDAIVTISDLCVASMKEVFPEYSFKISCIENIISEKTVNLYPVGSNPFQDEFSGIRIVTIGRVCRDKGVHLALESCALLKKRGFKLRWYWVGPFEDEIHDKLLPKEYSVVDSFFFLGATNNPYDFMRSSDLIVHPSYFEGKSVAIEEAKVLGKPIVATNFSTVGNQLIDGETGLVVPMDATALADAVERMIKDRDMYDKIAENLRPFKNGNESEIEKLYRLIDGEMP